VNKGKKNKNTSTCTSSPHLSGRHSSSCDGSGGKDGTGRSISSQSESVGKTRHKTSKGNKGSETQASAKAGESPSNTKQSQPKKIRDKTTKDDDTSGKAGIPSSAKRSTKSTEDKDLGKRSADERNSQFSESRSAISAPSETFGKDDDPMTDDPVYISDAIDREQQQSEDVIIEAGRDSMTVVNPPIVNASREQPPGMNDNSSFTSSQGYNTMMTQSYSRPIMTQPTSSGFNSWPSAPHQYNQQGYCPPPPNQAGYPPPPPQQGYYSPANQGNYPPVSHSQYSQPPQGQYPPPPNQGQYPSAQQGQYPPQQSQSPWGYTPCTLYNSGSDINQYRSPDVNTSAVHTITTQPTSIISRVTRRDARPPPAATSAAVLSVPSHRRVDAPSTSRGGAVDRGLVSRRATLRSHSDRDTPSDHDDSDSDDDDVDIRAVMPTLRGDSGFAAGLSDSDEGDDADPSSESLKVVFSRDKVIPVLREAGRVAGVEFKEDEKPQSSLIFGNLSLGHRKSTPVIRMPQDVYDLLDQVKQYYKGKLGGSKFFDQLLRVPPEDFTQLFTPPILDQDVVEFLKGSRNFRQRVYLPVQEKNLRKLDASIKNVTRLAAFQLMILNRLCIELSDGQAGDVDAPDGAFAMSRLASDLAGQLVSQSMRTSMNIIILRRNNVYAGISGKYKDDIISRLTDLKLNNEAVFARKFTKVIKKVARKVKRDNTIGSSFGGASSTRSSRGKGKGKGASSSGFGNSRYTPYNNRGRGKGSRQNNQSSSGSGYNNRRDNRRRSDQNYSRGRGQGKAQSRF